MEKKKYLFPNFTVTEHMYNVIVMSGTWSDSDDFDTVLEGGWLI